MSKNTRNRILLTAVAALLLVCVTVGGTMAWLVANTNAVTNTFTTSDLNVDIEETKREYQIIPGGDDDKDPKAWIVEGSEPAYLFVVITETNNTFTVNDETVKYITYNLGDGWTQLSSTTDTETGVITTVIWRSVTEAQIDVKYDILANNKVYYNTEITKTTMPTTQPTIAFQAYACQSANVADAATAWSYVQNNGLTPVTTD